MPTTYTLKNGETKKYNYYTKKTAETRKKRTVYRGPAKSIFQIQKMLKAMQDFDAKMVPIIHDFIENIMNERGIEFKGKKAGEKTIRPIPEPEPEPEPVPEPEQPQDQEAEPVLKFWHEPEQEAEA